VVTNRARPVCKGAGDDLAHRKRAASTPGPWCASCRRERRLATSARTHDSYVVKTYGLEPGEYARLLELQGGQCPICSGPLTATKRRYAVDHDHKVEKTHGVRWSIRGLLCKRHNNLLRDVRDDIDTLQAAIDYLKNPPAWPITRAKGRE
jgi:Recombination endonuclease VII